jgi:hypothetical protein
MTVSFSTTNLQHVLTFPFRGERWQAKLLTGMGFMLASYIIPVVPFLILYGYIYQIMHQVIVEQGELEMAEWTDWSGLIKDGWRLFCVGFLYCLPSLLAYLVGMGLYFGSFIGMMSLGNENDSRLMPLLMTSSMGILFISMALSMLFVLALLVFLPAASGHTVAKGTFSAGFDFAGWWKVLKTNPGGFLIVILVICGLGALLMIISQVIYMTVVLCCLLLVAYIGGGFYILLVAGGLTALVYRESVEKLGSKPV